MQTKDETDNAKHLFELIATFSTAMLVTRTAESTLRARPLSVASSHDDGRVYFSTSIDSPKVLELDDDAQVVVTFQDSRRYISLSGTAQVLRDRLLIDRLWSETWRVWFPGGKDDPSLAIIAVTPSEGEYWDETGIAGARYVLRSIKGYVTGTKPPEKIDDRLNAKVRL
jgi:general stress protein 26